MTRHIRQIINLPISQLSDEEIVKAAMHRLNAQGVALMYIDADGQQYFFTRYRHKVGRTFVSQWLKAWENLFGKMKRI
jgi:hypothetical protein